MRLVVIYVFAIFIVRTCEEEPAPMLEVRVFAPPSEASKRRPCCVEDSRAEVQGPSSEKGIPGSTTRSLWEAGRLSAG